MSRWSDLARATRRLRELLSEQLAAGHDGLLQATAAWPVAGDGAAEALSQFAAFSQLVPPALAPSSPFLAQARTLRHTLSGPAELLAAFDLVAATAAALGPLDHAGFEQFLAAYDAPQRRSHGAFYTPAEVVAAQVRWADALVRGLGLPAGLAAPSVVTIDPAMGTGVYLLAVLSARPTARVHGRELMPGPCAVAETLVRGAQTAASLSWCDALTAPLPPDGAIRVCIGNPPYARGDASHPRTTALLAGDVAAAVAAGHGGDVKNLYNLYVEFWSWAIREVFESRPDRAGLISFVTASSFQTGDAFVGLRERLRRACDAVWVVDLGGEGRGGRQEQNVFAIQSPVAITVAFRRGRRDRERPAEVRYRRLAGDRAGKLHALERLASLDEPGWLPVACGWQAPFRPSAPDAYLRWPALTDLLPWQHSGVQPKRTWPIAPDPETLRERWAALLDADDRAAAMRATADRDPGRPYPASPAGGTPAPPLAELAPDAPAPDIVPYALRSFDRQWLLADSRLLSRPRPALWQAHGPQQRYFATSLSLPLGHGPALTVSAATPDLHVFCGRGAKDILPLYRDAAARQPNLAPGLLPSLSQCYGRTVTVDDLAGYLYGILAHPGYTCRFRDALASAPPHVPLTADPALFTAVADAGHTLCQLHLEGADGGRARCEAAVPPDPEHHPAEVGYDAAEQALYLGTGRFAEVAPEVMRFEVSGLKVVGSWLGYRLATPRGRREAPLDRIVRRGWPAAWTVELLRLLWTLEATLASYPRLDALLSEVLEQDLIGAASLS